MRRVDDLAGLHDALKLTRQEAASAFGDPTVLLKKFIATSRHVKVEILVDKHGQVVHLFELGCSIQRNYQKLIEEAPASNLSATVRERLLHGAVTLAEAIAYDNVGTVESMVKAHYGELVNRVLYDCQKFHGGFGCIRESAIEVMLEEVAKRL